MSYRNQFLVVPMMKEMGPVDTWSRRQWADPDLLLDEVFGDFYDPVPYNFYGDNLMVPATKPDQNFQVQLDVSQFTPDEIKVRVLGRDVIIDGKHEERRDDHGYISRSFRRRYSF